MFINDPGHMTKMVAMPNLACSIGGLEYYNVSINHNLWMTLSYFTARST